MPRLVTAKARLSKILDIALIAIVALWLTLIGLIIMVVTTNIAIPPYCWAFGHCDGYLLSPLHFVLMHGYYACVTSRDPA